jgi:hypothetical protein
MVVVIQVVTVELAEPGRNLGTEEVDGAVLVDRQNGAAAASRR